MESFDPVSAAKALNAKRSYGQNFLIDQNFADYEAEFANGKRVVEFGSGLGMLTIRLCKRAVSVVAVEKDPRLFHVLNNSFSSPNLRLINSDFFSLGENMLGSYDIIIGNIPYNASSKLAIYLIQHGRNAVICVQKEFVEHLLAKPKSDKYSRISVLSSLYLNVKILMGHVPAAYFFPKPKVDSSLIELTSARMPGPEFRVISALMSHKKKKIANAIIDSSKEIGFEKQNIESAINLSKLPAKRPFEMAPEEIFASASEISRILADFAVYNDTK
ncbi:MAG: 16S rRNA (adenine(1518)-N(6)/adenine(1519)-N(6))-dimethyltransferase RsmA [Candidatus Micrarchaeaceae archaeon]